LIFFVLQNLPPNGKVALLFFFIVNIVELRISLFFTLDEFVLNIKMKIDLSFFILHSCCNRNSGCTVEIDAKNIGHYYVATLSRIRHRALSLHDQ